MITSRLLPATLVLLALSYPDDCSAQGFRSPLLQIWGVNLLGTRRLTPAEVWGVGLERTQDISFDPDEGYRLRAQYQKKYGYQGRDLIDLVGKGRHVDDAARELDLAYNNRVYRRYV